jgi:Zn2+/Cd2+-exporting ATPase
VRILPAPGYTGDTLLALAAAAESHSNHPIAQSIREARRSAGDGGDDGGSAATGHEEIGGRGVAALVHGRRVLAGNDLLMHDEKVPHDTCAAEGTVVHVADDGRYAGHIVIADEPKEDAAEAVQALRRLGVRRIVMLTGDRAEVARAVGGALDIDEVQGDLLPEGKLAHLERIMAVDGGRPTAFVGDGINDAPVLARADVGIAMGRDGADAAVESADVVLMTDHPAKVAEAVRRGRRTRTIVLQNIVLALGVKAAVLLLAALGIATMWEAVIADMGVALLAILNATRALR